MGIVLDAIVALFQPITELIKNLHLSKEDKMRLENEMAGIQAGLKMKAIELESELVRAQSEIVKAEVAGHWFQRNWRPALMWLTIVIIGNNYVLFPYASLFTDKVVMLELPEWLFRLLAIGMGGYTVGRSAEKIVTKLQKGKESDAPAG